MSKILKTICFFVTFLIAFFGYSQNQTLEPNYIKTVILRSNNTNNYAPIIKLGDKFELSFDDSNADETEYYYKIEHCTFNWDISNLNSSEYIDGFNEDRIRDYQNSFNTLQPYTHYQVSFPNENTQIKISGNYLISVLNEDDEVIFQRKFLVYQPKVTVGVSIHKSRDVATIETKQSVEFIINHPNLVINNASEEIKPIILQNDNWQFTINNLKPQFYRGTQLLYKYNAKTSFWAGNEFLYFDNKSIRNSSLHIVKSELGKQLYHTYLYPNEPRSNEPYTLYPDINGNFIIRTLDGENPNTDADYSWVHFTLKMPKLLNESVYVNGSFNNWKLNDTNRLFYNEKLGQYEASILLKQGFYNYDFVTVNKNKNISNHEISGSHYQTENNYTVLVYYKKFGSRYTQIIGVGYGNSKKLTN
ncbi:MAG: DUF5103 domain-containing protein [Lutibacter sp.]|uniref:type IX secretion system plug protein n=1 Tax=Lutibacter sp. TaxID=1925666 RepID=UPI00299EC13E|nr:DUF5103 domain-containing protein [Lutibacter sp.]MDX1828580.1 DUF5103 domain-containing protein [Lutibacter sp.]